jgi:hypothetical protein
MMTSKPDFHKLSFNDLLNIIGWSKTIGAYKLEIQARTFKRWAEEGKSRAPPKVRAWLEDLAEYHWFHHKPVNWNDDKGGE